MVKIMLLVMCKVLDKNIYFYIIILQYKIKVLKRILMVKVIRERVNILLLKGENDCYE